MDGQTDKLIIITADISRLVPEHSASGHLYVDDVHAYVYTSFSQPCISDSRTTGNSSAGALMGDLIRIIMLP